ncbi:threo-3-hydroxyaspartate ammonia-lyase [Colletotrichum orchidophilum]|uniref:Threo-3-hydroxyaspartate ammonia-lyase n=1 Tax=Colletotrichum orchidophilum TaxID=1209926 RepID=A0A1G4AWY7_9PEZI|nr:threo-3-hydroxyaspartate ammonia-lyase [Colletotrichum orchidophilum]OHE93625.1 threo-3-hydroxyaspartate ammonia-lyase [Colletotrichum orchidophilum]
MPTTPRPNKIAAAKGYGANVVFSGPDFSGHEVVAARIVAEFTGARLVPPHGQRYVILGQAKAELEPHGGGLLFDTTLSCEGTRMKVFGAEPEFEGADDGRRRFYSCMSIA